MAFVQQDQEIQALPADGLCSADMALFGGTVHSGEITRPCAYDDRLSWHARHNADAPKGLPRWRVLRRVTHRVSAADVARDALQSIGNLASVAREVRFSATGLRELFETLRVGVFLERIDETHRINDDVRRFDARQNRIEADDTGVVPAVADDDEDLAFVATPREVVDAPGDGVVESGPGSLVNGADSGSALRTKSLNVSAKISSLALLLWTNAAAAATTRSRLPCMLPLLSIRSPMVTGASSLVNNRMVCGCPSSKIRNASCRRPPTYSPFLVLTVTCSTTNSDSAEKVGRSCDSRPNAAALAPATTKGTSITSSRPCTISVKPPTAAGAEAQPSPAETASTTLSPMAFDNVPSVTPMHPDQRYVVRSWP